MIQLICERRTLQAIDHFAGHTGAIVPGEREQALALHFRGRLGCGSRGP